MDVLLQQPAAPDTRGTDSFWSNPLAWLRQKKLGRAFWVFFTAAFFFDAGFAVYFFLFNLYLLDCGFKERAIGLVGGAFTFGTVLGTLPAGLLARKIGVKRLLVCCFVAAPLVNTVRTVWMGEAAQVGFAFLAGLAMCTWGVCFLPAVARLTTEGNRASAFSLIFSVSIGTSALGGLVCGYLPQWLRMAGFAMQGVEVKRLILQVSCGIALVGLIAVLRLRIPSQTAPDALAEIQPLGRSWFGGWKLHPFLLRFLPLMALWSAILAAFTPFANVYLARDLHIPFARIGLIFFRSVGPVMLWAADAGGFSPARTNQRHRRNPDRRGCRPCLDGWSQRRTAGGALLFDLLRGAVDEQSGFVQPADDRDAGQGAQHGRCDDAAL